MYNNVKPRIRRNPGARGKLDLWQCYGGAASPRDYGSRVIFGAKEPVTFGTGSTPVNAYDDWIVNRFHVTTLLKVAK